MTVLHNWDDSVQWTVAIQSTFFELTDQVCKIGKSLYQLPCYDPTVSQSEQAFVLLVLYSFITITNKIPSQFKDDVSG